ncbi:MAG: aminotransferase class I/II-fold pyridoxal phosphate-dependent enzyme [Kiritimatiellia bacterium]
MTYDFDFFDRSLNRAESDSSKWTRYGKEVIPLWIADMDFRVCNEITEALTRRAQEGCFGYARDSEATIQAMMAWHQDLYGWKIEREWVVPQPGVVTSLNLFCRLLRETRLERSHVLIGEPIYHHFIAAAKRQQTVEHRIALNLFGTALPPLETIDSRPCGGWLFCNPENPLGYLWQEAELRGVIDYAQAHDVLLASDEIHGGLVLDEPFAYHPLLKCARNDAERKNIMSFIAPSKTFNIPGLGCSFAIIPNPEYRVRFTREYDQLIPQVNLFGWVGTEAAYRYGEPWRKAVLAYLRRNRSLIEAAATQWHFPLCKMNATYLAFMDCTSLISKLQGETAAKFFLKHGVAVHDGAMFGQPGWVRINIATQTALLRTAIERMGNAIASLY